MLVFPNCKINLGLHILAKREDGFHDLETVFYPVPFTDALELIPRTTNNTDIAFTGTGLAVAGDPDDNLCCQAFHLLKKDFPGLPGVKIHLHKAIPLGAGLGGGSADASFMLQLLNDRFDLGIPQPALMNYALQLGSDCPFFLINKPCLAAGRGEVLEEVAITLSSYKIVLINPGIHINTGWAFSNTSPALPGKPVKEIIRQPLETWRAELSNDFETPVFSAHREIKEIKEALYNQGALYASLSGSGSTVYGIFDTSFNKAWFTDRNYFIKIIN